MQVNKELLKSEITGLEARQKEMEASVNRITGALIFARDLLTYLEREEAKEEPQTEISDVNAEIQARDEAALKAFSEAQQPDYDFPDYDPITGG
jgi:hypothetical protein